MIRLRTLLAALGLTLAASACTPKDPHASCARSAEKAPVVKLITAGQAPHAPMRLVVTKGQQEKMVMTMKMAMAMDGVTKLPRTQLPPMLMTMGVTVTEVAANGDFRQDFILEGSDVLAGDGSPPAMVEAMRTSMGAMKGMKGHARLSSRGEVCESSLEIPDTVSPQQKQTMDGLQQSLQQVSVPFPDEPVGVGARWEVTYQLNQLQGMDLTQVATYELLERTATTVKIAATIVQSAKPQTVNPPGLPPGAVVHLDSLDSKGSGTTVFDLKKVVPQGSGMTLSTAFAMTIEMSGQKEVMKMNMDLDVSIEPGK
ncbi:MAG: hypothetical protein H0T76_02445 [Nannocystis sp.]|nr:DUF6263 family protein [Nannocystis sp.]MBA3545321.1 hypothetical protein [Nannocystis sp.]